VASLVVSDVVGSPADVIASGPTVADPTTFADALEVVRRHEIAAPPAVVAHLQAGAAGELPETPRPGDPVLDRSTAHLVADNRTALEGACREAQALGYRAEIVADDLEGEAREAARGVATLALGRRAGLAQGDPPLALLLGGETTVTVAGGGRGGRNQELALALACELDGREGVVAAALGTDGVDGPTDAAGALVDGGTLRRGSALGLSAAEHLRRNDSHRFLRATGDLLVTGPTGTNVNDVVLLLLHPPEP
jgi:glycerate-2-kinase